MHIFGDYIYDSERLIFYKKDTPQNIIRDICASVKITDKYDELKHTLDCLNKNKMTAKEKPINLIGICLTYNCQLRCNYCSYSSADGNKDLLTTDDIIVFVVEAIKKRKIYSIAKKTENIEPLRFFFTGGGEPTFNWNLFMNTVCAIKEKCNQYSIPYHFELTTNGMLNKNQIMFIVENFDKIMLSYDGLPYLQNKNRKCVNNNQSNSIVENTLTTFINNNKCITVRSTVWHEDFIYLKDICDNLACNFKGINEWSIMPIVPSGRALINSQLGEYDTIDKNFFDYYIDLVKYSKKKKYDLYISTPVFNNSIAEFCCGATFTECFWLMPDKKVINCIEAEQFKTEVANIQANKVNFCNHYIDQHLDTVRETFTRCKSCLAYRFCKGGCPLKIVRDKNFGTNYREYECQMIRQYWKYVFEEILSDRQCFGWMTEEIILDNLPEKSVYKILNFE